LKRQFRSRSALNPAYPLRDEASIGRGLLALGLGALLAGGALGGCSDKPVSTSGSQSPAETSASALAPADAGIPVQRKKKLGGVPMHPNLPDEPAAQLPTPPQ